MTGFLDRVAIRMITRLIFIHMGFCLYAIFSPFILGAEIYSFVKDLNKAKTLLNEAEIIEVPRIYQENERMGHRRGFRCYLSFQSGEYECFLPAMPPKGPTLSIYSHPSLKLPPSYFPDIVAVPANPDLSSVYFSYTRKTLKKSVIKLFIILGVTIIVNYIAIRGYIFIKRGRRRRRH